MTNKIGIILGSTREGRVSESVGKWVLEQTKDIKDIQFEIVDIRDYNLPFLGTSKDLSGVEKWNQKLNELDGFVFVVAEYNHSMTAALKNALDSAKDAWNYKAAGIVSYGSAGGARAAEHLKAVLIELQVAVVRAHVLLTLFDDFENFSIFKPRSIHLKNLQVLFKQLNDWTNAVKVLRK